MCSSVLSFAVAQKPTQFPDKKKKKKYRTGASHPRFWGASLNSREIFCGDAVRAPGRWAVSAAGTASLERNPQLHVTNTQLATPSIYSQQPLSCIARLSDEAGSLYPSTLLLDVFCKAEGSRDGRKASCVAPVTPLPHPGACAAVASGWS